MLQHIRLVLVETTHPGNIGAVARAMKTMGLSRLYLVSPKIFPSGEATVRASGADDILQNAVVCESLAEAIGDCQRVYGTSTRHRSLDWPVQTPKEAAQCALECASEDEEVAFVFGRESSGLRNDELDLCQWRMSIPSNPEFSSLNLAAAVQVVSYELYQGQLTSQANEPIKREKSAERPVTQGELDGLLTHWTQMMQEIGYYDPDKPRQLTRRMARLFAKAQIDVSELNILRGIAAAVLKRRNVP